MFLLKIIFLWQHTLKTVLLLEIAGKEDIQGIDFIQE